MAKLTIIERDDAGNVIITHTELPREPEKPEMSSSSPPRKQHTQKRVPSSPHKPYTSANFYDLTKTDSPDTSPIASVNPGKENILGVRLREQVEQVESIPGPFAQSQTGSIPPSKRMDSETSTTKNVKKSKTSRF